MDGIPLASLLSLDPFTAAAARRRESVRPTFGRQEGLGTKVPVRIGEDILHALGSLATLPQRALGSAAEFERSGHYDPAPMLETAGMMVGSPLTPRGALGSSAGGLAASTPERIERAAVNLGGKVFAGPNHATAIRVAEKSTGRNFDDLLMGLPSAENIDGFLTSSGRFVSRNEAALIAEQSRQLKPNIVAPTPAEGGLLTEDMRRGAIWGLPLAGVPLSSLPDALGQHP